MSWRLMGAPPSVTESTSCKPASFPAGTYDSEYADAHQAGGVRSVRNRRVIQRLNRETEYKSFIWKSVGSPIVREKNILAKGTRNSKVNTGRWGIKKDGFGSGIAFNVCPV